MEIVVDPFTASYSLLTCHARFHAHEKLSLQRDMREKTTGENGGGEIIHFTGKRNRPSKGIDTADEQRTVCFRGKRNHLRGGTPVVGHPPHGKRRRHVDATLA